jgi:tetratricopeptide (TPR) repeat protein
MSPKPKTHAQRQEAAAARSQAGAAPSGKRDWIFGLLLVFAVIVAYQPAWNGKPIWDDDEHITRPELRSLGGLARIWIEPGASQQYYPLVHSIFWVEHRLWGDGTPGYHLMNILLHAGCGLVLVKILQRLEVSGGWLAAAIFALHPLQVETVAWITELKNTLSGVCCLGAALVYLNFDRDRKWTFYASALGLFILGLMAKTVIVTLPAALLVVFWWKRGRLSWQKDALPLLPFFVVGIACGLFTAWMERKFIGAEGSEFDFSLVERCLIAGRAFWFYLGKLFWPANLVFNYPRWNVSQAVWWQYLFPAAALLLLAGFGLLRRRSRGPLAGLLFFAGTLFPALGFINVYPFRYSFVADHFQYLAGIGPITLAAAGITIASGFFEGRKPFVKPVLCGVLLATLGMLTWRQCGMYADIETLWRTTIDRNPNSFMAHLNLGIVLAQKGSVDDAITQFQKTLEIKPDYAKARNNLGLALLQKGSVNEAITQFRKVIEINPNYAEACFNLGNALIQKGSVDEAIVHYQKALEIKPDYAEAHYNLGNALIQKGSVDEAMVHYQEALQIKPDYAEAHNNLGKTLLNRGSVDEAITRFQKVLQIKPDHANACYNLGLAFLQKGRADEAITCFQKTLRIKPDFPEAQNDLAWVWATSSQASLRNGNKAVELAAQANQLAGGKNPFFLHTLAAACAEAGQFDDAIQNAQKAIELARAAGRPDLVEQLNGELKLYEARLPFHQESK